MHFACNIDRRGRWIRGLLGVFALALAGGALFWSEGRGTVYRGAAAVLAVAGAFGVYEACRGWCIARGMGFKTPF
jgi:hypothetical protein